MKEIAFITMCAFERIEKGMVFIMRISFEENKSVAYDNDKQIGECDFVEKEDTWNIVHTEVSNAYQGQGIARKLVECVIENAKKCNKKLVADCSYAKIVLERQNRN